MGYGANSLGGPLGTLICTAVAAELGKIVSKETKVDILVTPTVTIVSGLLIARLAGPGVSAVMTGFGNLIMRATEMHPFFMGILVSVLVGVALTLPISSAAICASFGTAGLIGLAGGAATAGCCAQMVGFAVMSFRENRYGGLVAQGLGTSMLQMGNIVKNPRIWLPPTIVSAITGPIASWRFQNGKRRWRGKRHGYLRPCGPDRRNGERGLRLRQKLDRHAARLLHTARRGSLRSSPTPCANSAG